MKLFKYLRTKAWPDKVINLMPVLLKEKGQKKKGQNLKKNFSILIVLYILYIKLKSMSKKDYRKKTYDRV